MGLIGGRGPTARPGWGLNTQVGHFCDSSGKRVLPALEAPCSVLEDKVQSSGPQRGHIKEQNHLVYALDGGYCVSLC